jgi:hypothetical protein
MINFLTERKAHENQQLAALSGARISISRYAPRNAAAGYRVYSKLAPGPWFNKVGAAEFCRLYGAQLAALDPQRTFDELVALAAPHEPVLMCWEVPPFHIPTNWCHRHLVADWFKATIGVEVPELEIPASAAIKLGRGMVRNATHAAPDHVVPRAQ